MVPNTLGWGVELLIRIIAPGSVKLRPTICRLNTQTSVGQMRYGLSGIRARNGMSVYAIALNGRVMRYSFKIPNLVLSRG